METLSTKMIGKFKVRICERLSGGFCVFIEDTTGGNFRYKDAARMSTIDKFIEKTLSRFIKIC